MSGSSTRRVLFAGLALVLLAGCGVVGGGSRSGNSRFVSVEGRFLVVMPDDREEATETVPTPVGNLETHSVIGRVNDEESFGVFYADVPETTGEIDIDASFEGAIANSIAASPGLALVYRNQTFAYGGPALDFVLEAADRKVWARIAIIGRRTYLIQHSGPNLPETGRHYEEYVDTFEVLTRRQAEELGDV